MYEIHKISVSSRLLHVLLARAGLSTSFLLAQHRTIITDQLVSHADQVAVVGGGKELAATGESCQESESASSIAGTLAWTVKSYAEH